MRNAQVIPCPHARFGVIALDTEQCDKVLLVRSGKAGVSAGREWGLGPGGGPLRCRGFSAW